MQPRHGRIGTDPAANAGRPCPTAAEDTAGRIRNEHRRTDEDCGPTFRRRLRAEIVGADVRNLDQRDFRSSRTLNRCGVIVLRDQTLTAREFHSRRLFGELETHTLLQYTLPDDEKIYVLANIERTTADRRAQ